jgi:hypothetical protein
MNILIIGGSNSLVKNGYVYSLYDCLSIRNEIKIQQLSVGGTTSLSAIGRITENYNGQNYDYILYEYSINDNGHFSWRKNGIDSYILCFQLLLQTVKELYPSAIFIPLIFAAENNFVPRQNSFQKLQIDIFNRMGIKYIDIQEYLFQTFFERKPSWLYKDTAHYNSPYTTEIIGSYIARRILEMRINLNKGGVKLSEVNIKLLNKTEYNIKYLPSSNMVRYMTGEYEALSANNKLMNLEFIRMYPGSKLNIDANMYPIALYIKSDKNHYYGKLKFNDDINNKAEICFSICHADTSVLPFIYTSIPVPLLTDTNLRRNFGASNFELEVIDRLPNGIPINSFDCFIEMEPNNDRYLDLLGILFISNRE